MTVDEVIAKMKDYLHQNQPTDALRWLERSGATSSLLDNARGVCLLRTGQYQPALSLFRGLVFPRGVICMDTDTPTAFQTNYITTMMLLGNVPEAFGLLGQISNKMHPAAKRLRQALADWKAGHGTFQRMLISLGFSKGRPFNMDAPGDIE